MSTGAARSEVPSASPPEECRPTDVGGGGAAVLATDDAEFALSKEGLERGDGAAFAAGDSSSEGDRSELMSIFSLPLLVLSRV
jgi:hypothetical protein